MSRVSAFPWFQLRLRPENHLEKYRRGWRLDIIWTRLEAGGGGSGGGTLVLLRMDPDGWILTNES